MEKLEHKVDRLLQIIKNKEQIIDQLVNDVKNLQILVDKIDFDGFETIDENELYEEKTADLKA